MNFEPKGKRKLEFYSTKEIKPKAWMLKQLRIQAESLCGILDKVWPDIRDSKWIGGDGDGWERLPYWLDGFIPLAYLLDDDDMKGRVEKYINAILAQQQSDGWLCPCEESERWQYDAWAFFLISKVLVQYYNCTGDERIYPCLYKAFKYYDKHIGGITLYNWGMMRWSESFIALLWLYEKYKEDWILKLAKKIRAQGFDYAAFYQDPWLYTERDEKDKWSQTSHVVNNAMGIKSGALYYLLSGDKKDLQLPDVMLEKLFKYHSTVAGGFTGDECLAGDSPIQGTELCATVEMMYSLEQLISISGQAKYAEMLETLAYNALPAAFTPDMWAHQYNTISNQVEVSEQKTKDAPFMTNEGDSHVLGFEPHFGCCTANFNQGWPKFALAAFMKSAKGIAITSIQPSELKTQINGVAVSVEIDTQYPFRNKVMVTVNAEEAVEFELLLRIPSFVVNPVINKKPISAGDFQVISKTFQGKEAYELTFDLETEFIKRSRGLSAVKRGALVYSLKIEEDCHILEYNGKTHLTERKPYEVFPHCTYEYYPLSKFNYALTKRDIKFIECEFDDKFIFSPQSPPIKALAEMVEIPWHKKNGFLSEIPESIKALSEPTELELIPFACTNIRLTEFPLITDRGQ